MKPKVIFKTSLIVDGVELIIGEVDITYSADEIIERVEKALYSDTTWKELDTKLAQQRVLSDKLQESINELNDEIHRLRNK